MDPITAAIALLKTGAAAWSARGPAATAFLEKVSIVTGVVTKPWQTRRDAQADADATVIKARGNAEAELIRAESAQKIQTIEGRAELRVAAEQIQAQKNIEAIVAKAIDNIREDAKSEAIEDDWLANFFDKARLFSDNEVQLLWSQILAGEANAPGSFSRRTINFLADLDKEDAMLFRKLCSFIMADQKGRNYVFILDFDNFYADRGITIDALTHLDAIRLLRQPNGVTLSDNPYDLFTYFGRRVRIGQSGVFMGEATLTKIGQELACVCQPAEDATFLDYLMDSWRAGGQQVEELLEI